MVKFDLNVLDKDYDVFKSDSGLGLMTRAKNVLTTLKNTINNDAKKVILGATIVNNANEVINGAIIDANGNITLNGVNITNARVNNG